MHDTTAFVSSKPHPLAEEKGWTMGVDYPEWGNSNLYLNTISSVYLVGDETPKESYRRIAKAASERLKKPDLEDRFFEILWKGWLIPSTPVQANMGTDRGLPISCFSGVVPDSMIGIYTKLREMVMLSKNGGGTAYDFSNLRPIGSLINSGVNGKTDGIIPFMKAYDSAIRSAKQGQTRKGAVALYLNSKHGEFRQFLEIREPKGDVERQCHFIHQGAVLEDDFMKKVDGGDKDARGLFADIIKKRVKTGEPYMFFKDNANKNLNPGFAENGLTVKHSNLCVSGDTMILTNSGYKTMAELWELQGQHTMWENAVMANELSSVMGNGIEAPGGGDELYEFLINRNGLSKSTAVTMTNEAADMFRLTLSNGFEIKATSNHEFVMFDGTRKRLSELRKDDKVQLSPMHAFGEKEIDLNYALLCGYVTGGGSICIAREQQQAIIRVWDQDFPICDQLSDAVKGLSCYDQSTAVNDSDCRFNTTKIESFGYSRKDLSSTILGRLMKEDGLEPECMHRVPDSIWAANKDGVSSYLRGLFSATGSLQSDGSSCSVVLGQSDEKFVRDLQLLLSQFGIKSSFHHRRKYFYEVRFSSIEDLEIFRGQIGFLQSYKNEKLDLYLSTHNGSNNSHNSYYAKVVNIEFDGVEPSYCINEPESHELILNGIVTGNCAEIMLPTDEEHTLVCCLSSMNLLKYDEWKDSDAVYLATLFLDAVMEEFIVKADGLGGIEDAVRFAKKSRALGLGTTGWHSYLQLHMVPFDSIQAQSMTRLIYGNIRAEAERATKALAQEYGESEWTKGTGRRNLTLLAIAPNRSSAKLAGGVSQGIEPIAANIYTDDDDKGIYFRKNPVLKVLMKQKGLNGEVWDKISDAQGSIQHLDEFTDEEKEVFKTFREINQLELVRQAAVRQEYLDQGQSLNLAFFQDAPAKFMVKVHMEAWKLGIKSLYYLRSQSILRADYAGKRDLYSECLNCDG